MNSPQLSIVMPVYNASAFIKEAVESILSQTFSDFELIVVDDGCTDNSIEIVKQFDDLRIRIIRNEHNSGIVFSRNRGNEAARGRYIAPFDSDDIALPDKFEKQIAFLENNPEFGMIGSWAILIDENGRPLGKRWKLGAPSERIPSLLLFRNYFVQSSMVIRREAMPDGFYSPGFDVVEDYKMWIDITRNHKAWNYPEYLIKYRIHSKSITVRQSQKMNQRDGMIFDYLYPVLEIIPDDKQKSLLLALKNNQPVRNRKEMKELESFLKLILAKNKRQSIYDHKQLTKVVCNRFLKSWLLSIKHGSSASGTFFSSALHREFLLNHFRPKA